MSSNSFSTGLGQMTTSLQQARQRQVGGQGTPAQPLEETCPQAVRKQAQPRHSLAAEQQPVSRSASSSSSSHLSEVVQRGLPLSILRLHRSHGQNVVLAPPRSAVAALHSSHQASAGEGWRAEVAVGMVVPAGGSGVGAERRQAAGEAVEAVMNND